MTTDAGLLDPTDIKSLFTVNIKDASLVHRALFIVEKVLIISFSLLLMFFNLI